MTNPEDCFPDTRREEQELVGRGCICKPPTCPDCGEPMLDDREGGMYGGWICAANHRGIILEWDDPDCPQHGKRGDANAGGNHVSSDVAEPRSVCNCKPRDNGWRDWNVRCPQHGYGSRFAEGFAIPCDDPDAPGPSDRLEEGFLSVALSHFRLAVEQDHDVTLSPRHAGAVLAEIDRLRAEYKAMKEAGQGTLARQWAEIVKLRKALGEK